ncbi:hypothetical protein [Streptomyces sp. NPDC004528]|uniref:hypothetical protein n=1 Tax=Streptomyces sp. NPDC004528 TaxID=3154550 RepID=UPI0033BE8B86
MTLTPTQHSVLLSYTRVTNRPIRARRELQAALEGACQASGRYTLTLADEILESASYLLSVTSVYNGNYRLPSAQFDQDNILRTRGQTRRERLLSTLATGAEIHKVRTFQPIRYRPQNTTARRPWVGYDPSLRQHFRLPDQAVHPVWAAPRATAAGRRTPRRRSHTRPRR